MSLSDALRDPNDVTTLLLLQTNVRVEDTKVELLHEGLDVDLNLQGEGGRERGGREGVEHEDSW